MPRQLIDISMHLENEVVSEPPGYGPQIQYLTHKNTAADVVKFFPGRSWDAPFIHTRGKYSASGDAGLIWEGHKAGREIGYCHLEKLHNLEALPATGFRVSCFPVKIRGASAGWTRAVAILD